MTVVSPGSALDQLFGQPNCFRIDVPVSRGSFQVIHINIGQSGFGVAAFGPGRQQFDSAPQRRYCSDKLIEHHFREGPAVVGFREFGVFPNSASVKDGGLPIFACGEILVSSLDVLLLDLVRIPAAGNRCQRNNRKKESESHKAISRPRTSTWGPVAGRALMLSGKVSEAPEETHKRQTSRH